MTPPKAPNIYLPPPLPTPTTLCESVNNLKDKAVTLTAPHEGTFEVNLPDPNNKWFIVVGPAAGCVPELVGRTVNVDHNGMEIVVGRFGLDSLGLKEVGLNVIGPVCGGLDNVGMEAVGDGLELETGGLGPIADGGPISAKVGSEFGFAGGSGVVRKFVDEALHCCARVCHERSPVSAERERGGRVVTARRWQLLRF